MATPRHRDAVPYIVLHDRASDGRGAGAPYCDADARAVLDRDISNYDIAGMNAEKPARSADGRWGITVDGGRAAAVNGDTVCPNDDELVAGAGDI